MIRSGILRYDWVVQESRKPLCTKGARPQRGVDWEDLMRATGRII